MSRYIDADLIQYNEYIPDLDVWAASKTQIDNIPTADVRENVKGEWIDCGTHGDWAWEQDGHGNCWHIWKCSKCEHITEHRSNFCPNCGARMEGES